MVKKGQIKNTLGLRSSKTGNYNNKDFYSYPQKNEQTYSYYISHSSDTKRYIYHAENCPACAKHVEIKDNYYHQEQFPPLTSKHFFVKNKNIIRTF